MAIGHRREASRFRIENRRFRQRRISHARERNENARPKAKILCAVSHAAAGRRETDLVSLAIKSTFRGHPLDNNQLSFPPPRAIL